MKDEFQQEAERFERDVRRRAAELVRRGRPPLDAICIARDQISSERSDARKAAKSSENT